MSRTLLRCCVGGALLAVLSLDPFLGCDAGGYRYGETQMRSAVEGRWKLTITDPSAPVHEVVVSIVESHTGLEQHSARTSVFHQANACGTRSFVNTAGACMDISEMPLDVAVDAVVTRGTFQVFSTVFTHGRLTFRIGDAGAIDITGDTLPDGRVSEVSARVRSAPPRELRGVTLTRL